MQALSLLVAFSISLAGAQPAAQGTNGAGTTRTWTASGLESPLNTPFKATFSSVAGGLVSLSYSTFVNVTAADPNHRGRHYHQRVQQTLPVDVPLAKLSTSDREWVEDRNPAATCLTEKSKTGAVGTLSPKTGAYLVRAIVKDDAAVVEYVEKDKVVWSFELHSKLVPYLTQGQSYPTISRNLVPNFTKLPLSERSRFDVDFKTAKTRSNHHNRVEVLVEDNP
jgi:hypothetical protein